MTAFLCGFAFTGFAAVAHQSDQLDPALEGETFGLSARVEGFPDVGAGGVRFVVAPLDRKDLPSRIRLSWYDAATVPSIGETWRLQVRLKRPRGFANPGGFDFEGWLFQQRIGATGYVLEDAHSYRILGESPGLIDRARQRFVLRVGNALPADASTAVLQAVGVGARQGIDREQWQRYARTGTSHLMAISGLHIGLAAGFAYLLCRLLLAPVCRRRNARDVAVATAVLAATTYAALSGFAVPARRALWMVALAASAHWLRRNLGKDQLLGAACMLVLLANPLATLTPGFKLSFAAVAILFLLSTQHVRNARVTGSFLVGRMLSAFSRLAQLQLGLMAGLFPLTALLFDRVSLLAPAINMIVLPVFNFLTVPLTLAGGVLDGPAQSVGLAFLTWSHGSIRGVLWLVARFSDLEFASYRVRDLGLAGCLTALLPLVYVLLPPGWPGRKLAFVAMLSVLNYKPSPPPAGCLDYHVLDVGQGLAIVLQTHRHALLFDTGPAFQNGSNTAELVVLPFLYSVGIDRLDRMVVSHGDLDHAGGVRSILAAVPVASVLVGEPSGDLGRFQSRCAEGMRWRWDDISFSVLHPRNHAPWNRNNLSCVLRVQAGRYSLLLTGDIEAPAETLLVYREQLRSTDILVVPHHGSGTSSSPAFVEATGPRLAIVSAGFRNRWGFPRGDVVLRWENSGAEVVNTADAGAVSQRVCRDAMPGSVHKQRYSAQKFWHDRSSARP